MSGARPDTWMPFYIGDYLRDTQHLSAEKHGAYVLLIFSYWVSGAPLPDDDEHLSTVTRLTRERWEVIRPVIAAFFRVADGVWRHKRVDIELKRAKRISKERSKAGDEGAGARWGGNYTPGTRAERLAKARGKGTHTAIEWAALQEALDHKCVRCGIPASNCEGDRLCKDHVVPIYQGGSDGIDNLQPMCRNCNSAKGADATDLRKNVYQNWRERLADCLAKRLANVLQTPAPSQSQLQSKKDKKDNHYAFSGSVIRLTAPDLARWKTSFANLNGGLSGLLESRDAWLQGQPVTHQQNWFTSTAAWLAKKNTEAQPAHIQSGPDMDL